MLEETEEADLHRSLERTDLAREPAERHEMFIPFITIPRAERVTDEKDRECVTYVIEVNDGAQNDIVLRRYNEFVELNELIKKLHPTIELPSIPSKTLLKNSSKEFVEGRRSQLEKYLQGINKIDEIRITPHFRNFLTKQRDPKEENAYWKGKRICIVGASGGIGTELASQYAGKGPVKLALIGRREEVLTKIVERCKLVQKNVEVIIKPVDLDSQSKCQEMVETVVTELGGLDILVFAIGQGMNFKFDAVSNFDIMESVMRTNFYVPVWWMHSALKHLRESKGQVIVLTSPLGKPALPNASFYSAAKQALIGFFESLREEEIGMKVTVVRPNVVNTDTWKHLYSANGELTDDSKNVSQGKKLLTAEYVASRTIQAGRNGTKDITIDFGIKSFLQQ